MCVSIDLYEDVAVSDLKIPRGSLLCCGAINMLCLAEFGPQEDGDFEAGPHTPLLGWCKRNV